MKDNIFLIDSNLLIYAFDSSDKFKHKIAKKLLMKCFSGNTKYAVSLQNLSEFFVIITKKVNNPISESEAIDIIKEMIEFNGFIKLEPTKNTIMNTLNINITTNITYWDSLIVAVMIEIQVFDIYTENTKDYSNIKRINSINPFA